MHTTVCERLLYMVDMADKMMARKRCMLLTRSLSLEAQWHSSTFLSLLLADGDVETDGLPRSIVKPSVVVGLKQLAGGHRSNMLSNAVR